MQELSNYILEKYSYEDICNLQSLLDKIKTQKKVERDSKYCIINFYREYIKYIESTFSKAYLKSVKLSFSHFFNFSDKEKLLKDFTVKDAEDFKIYLMERAPKGYLVYLRTLKASFNVAKDWGWISVNPFTKIKFGRKQQVRPKFLSRSELNLILKNEKSQELADMYLFSSHTGCRLDETVNVKRKNIDIKNRHLTIGDSCYTSKNGKFRVIPISDELYDKVLKKKINIDKEAYVFTKSNSPFPFNKDYVSRSFKDARRRSGLSEEIHFHTLRHSFASNLAIKGVPITVIKELLGHSSIVVTQIYSHSNMESLKSAIQKLNYS